MIHEFWMDGAGIELHCPIPGEWIHANKTYTRVYARVYILLPELMELMQDIEDFHRYGLLLHFF